MKKGDENSPEKEGPSPAAEKSTSVGGVRRILFRGLIYSVLFFLLLIVSAGIVLEYFFPAEEVRAIAERTLSKKLKLPLKIQKAGKPPPGTDYPGKRQLECRSMA